MVTTLAGSTVPRRQLGRYLRQLRKRARMTVKAAAEALDWSPPKIWRIERGVTSMRSPDVAAMCRVYQVPERMTAVLLGLAKESTARGWWHSYGDAIPDWFELYVALEGAASRIRSYESQLVRGLLQTPAYAKEVFRVGAPDMSEADRERGVSARLARQAVLSRTAPPAPQPDVVLDEAVLRRRISGAARMAGQLRHINAVGRRPNVTIRVLPFDAGLHWAALANGAFTILEFPAGSGSRPAEPTIVYSDGLTGALYLERPAEIAAYDEVWASIQPACLSEAQSRELIASLAEEYAAS